MKWLIVALGLALAPALAGCQVTPEFVRAALCEPPVEVPAEPGGLLPVEPEPFGS